MRVSAVMTTSPLTVPRTASVRTALRMLSTNAITTLPVVDDRGRILGVVGEFDLLDLARMDETVDQVMRHLTVLTHPDSDVADACRLLRSTPIKSLPVVDASDQVVGMLSRSDVVRMLARDDDLLRQAVVDDLSSAGLWAWRVTVRNGVAELSRPADADADAEAAALRVAADVLGVRTARIA